MANERLTLEIAAITTGETSVDKLATSIDRLAASSARAGTVGGGAGRQIGEGFSHSVPEIAAASASIREFEGAIPIRAVERFLTTTLGLGGALSAIFPIAGAYAFGEMILATAEKYDPLLKAQAALSESNKKLDAEWKQLESRLEGLQARALTAQFGGKAGESLKAFFSESDARSFDATAAEKQRQIDTATIKLNTGKDASWMPGIIGSELTKRNEAAEQAKITQLTNERDMALSQAAASRQGVVTDQLEATKTARDAAAVQAKDNERATRAYEREGRDSGLTPVGKIYADASDKASAPGMTQSQRDRIDLAAARLADAALDKLQDEIEKHAPKAIPSFFDKMMRPDEISGLSELDRSNSKISDRTIRNFIDFNKKLGTENEKRDTFQIRDINDTAERQAKIAGADSRLDPIAAAQRQLEIRKQAIVADTAILDLSEGTYDQEEKRNALMQKASDIQSEFNKKLEEQKVKQEELFKSISGSLYDSFFGGGKGVSSFFKSQAEGIGKTIFENAAKLGQSAIMGAIPHANSCILSTLLKGTPFGPDPMKVATDANTIATQENTAAYQRATAGGSGGGSTGTLPSGISMAASAWPSLGGNPLSSMIPALPGPFDDPTRDPSITDINPDGYSYASPSAQSSALPKIGTATGDLMAGAAAITGVISGIRAFGGSGSGGVQGKLDGVGGILASASVITSLIKGVASSIPIVGSIVAAALPIIGSFFPNGPQARENQINKTLTEARYFAPTALNETMSTNGNYLSKDMRGNLQQTGFSARPQTENSYLFWGPNNSPIVAPGGVTSPYSGTLAPPAPAAPEVHLHIHAIDTQSGADFLEQHGAHIGEVVRNVMQQGDPAIMRTIRYNLNR